MTDIVERLRDPVNNWNSGGRFEAAAEIERLTAEVERCDKSNYELIAEIGKISLAIPAEFILDPPDGGDVSTVEGVRRVVAELTTLRTTNERLREGLEWFADAYDRDHPMRTADMHHDKCDCLRCCRDNARAALTKEPSND